MEEGTILKWRVKEGDAIAVGQIICEIETDKANIEMEATDAGRLAKIVAAEGSVVPVKQAIAYFADKSSDVEAYLSNQGKGERGETETRTMNRETRNEVGGGVGATQSVGERAAVSSRWACEGFAGGAEAGFGEGD